MRNPISFYIFARALTHFSQPYQLTGVLLGNVRVRLSMSKDKSDDSVPGMNQQSWIGIKSGALPTNEAHSVR